MRSSEKNAINKKANEKRQYSSSTAVDFLQSEHLFCVLRIDKRFFVFGKTDFLYLIVGKAGVPKRIIASEHNLFDTVLFDKSVESFFVHTDKRFARVGINGCADKVFFCLVPNAVTAHVSGDYGELGELFKYVANALGSGKIGVLVTDVEENGQSEPCRFLVYLHRVGGIDIKTLKVGMDLNAFRAELLATLQFCDGFVERNIGMKGCKRYKVRILFGYAEKEIVSDACVLYIGAKRCRGDNESKVINAFCAAENALYRAVALAGKRIIINNVVRRTHRYLIGPYM